MRHIFNFSAGPAVLPRPVLEQAAEAVREINGSGMSLLEVSHRGRDYDPIHFDVIRRVLSVLNLSADEYNVLLLTGGASTQFSLLPMNFLGKTETADYIDAGDWGAKAAKEASRFGNVHIAGSSKASGYDKFPRPLSFSPEGTARYAHLTTNNTIEGSQWHGPLPPTNGAPLVCDASSDIFAVDRDYSGFDLIYFGAQKNAGAAGVTVVVARRAFLETANTDLPPMFSYLVQAEKDSLYNTPPVFPIYVLGKVLEWIEDEGGVSALDTRNREKAALIYDALNAAPDIYRPCIVEPGDRSLMNITFRLAHPEWETELLAEAKERDMDGLPGHRSVGGLRASVYNAFPTEGCRALADLLTDFARRKG